MRKNHSTFGTFFVVTMTTACLAAMMIVNSPNALAGKKRPRGPHVRIIDPVWIPFPDAPTSGVVTDIGTICQPTVSLSTTPTLYLRGVDGYPFPTIKTVFAISCSPSIASAVPCHGVIVNTLSVQNNKSQWFIEDQNCGDWAVGCSSGTLWSSYYVPNVPLNGRYRLAVNIYSGGDCNTPGTWLTGGYLVFSVTTT